MTHSITLTPAQLQRLQVILAVWAEMLACESSLEEPEDSELLELIGAEETCES